MTPTGDAFRITKASQAPGSAAKVAKPAASAAAPEAGEGKLSFGAFEAALEVAKGQLSGAKTLYVCEGDVPGTRVPCRVITDSAEAAATAMGSVLERMPKSAEANVLPVTAYLVPGGADFAGFVVEQGDGVIYHESAVVADVVLSGASATGTKLWASIAAAAEEIKK